LLWRQTDQRDLMRAQLVDSFMASDWLRYQQALFWLRDWAEANKLRSGRVRHGNNWFDPEIYARQHGLGKVA
jgi:hypothetical protein